MKSYFPESGAVVRSKAGRDANRLFAVLRTEGDRYAWLADGDLRKVLNPKKKQYKHLEVLPCKLEGIADTVRNGKLPTDAEVRKALDPFKANGK